MIASLGTFNGVLKVMAANGVVSYTTQNDGVLFTMNTGRMKLRVCKDDIIRVMYTPTTSFSSRASFMVNNSFGVIPAFSVSETSSVVTMTTAKLKTEVNKTTGAVKFYDSANNVLCQERSDGGRTVSSVSYDGDNGYSLTQVFTTTSSEALYGLGGYASGGANRKGQKITLKQSNASSIAIPYLLSTKGYGILWDNNSHTTYDGTVGQDISFASEMGDQIDYYFIYGPEFDTLIARYRETTGKAPLFPKWAYGFFQSKERYVSQSDLLSVAQNFRTKQIPLDCIVQDWQYWGNLGWNALKFDPAVFPDPVGMTNTLHNQNIKMMISIWSNFGTGIDVYNALNAQGYIVTNSGGWPSGTSYYNPYINAAGEIYWNYINSGLFSKGLDGWWMDSAEPGDTDPVNWGSCSLGSYRRLANAYPMATNGNVYRNQRNATSGKRVYILTRSSFAGAQRNAASVWPGDFHAGWDVFKQHLAIGLGICSAGVPYYTTDIGAFWCDYSGGNTNTEYRELYTRWYQWGAFNPIFRSHGTSTAREMWNFGNPGTPYYDSQLTFDKLRYRLMPYIYSLGWKVTNEGYTMMRTLPFDFRNDANTYNINDQYMFGNFLVAPVYTYQATSRNVYLPSGTTWYDYWTGNTYAGGQTITAAAPISIMPLYVKAGSIIPMGPHIQYATQAVDPMEIRVYQGANGSFNLYEDEGDNYNYESGSYSIIPFTYNDVTKQLTIGGRTGSFPGMLTNRTFNIVWVQNGYGAGLDLSGNYQSVVNYNGSAFTVTYDPAWNPGNKYEAENATLSGGAVVMTDHTGFSGSGFVAGYFSNASANTLFNVNMSTTGQYNLTVRYSAGNGTSTNTALYVNGTRIKALTCNATTNWDTWADQNELINLNSGNNTIELRSEASVTANINIDYITLTGQGPTPTPTPTPTPSGSNLSLNKPVTVSSTADNCPGPNAVDGNTGTRWSSAYSDPQWIYVDLGSDYNINRVVLRWEAAYGKSYQIQVSNDAINWTNIYSTTSGSGGVNDLTGLSGSGRYVRMYGTQRGATYGYSLWEFEVYGSSTPTPTPTPTPGGVLFQTGLESGNTQPTWVDTIEVSSNVIGYISGINPECSVRTGETSHAGTASLMFSGTDNSTTTSFCYFKVFDVNIPITLATKLNYWFYPQMDLARGVAVDFVCTDGTTLRDSGAKDQNGISMHPGNSRGAINTWNQVQCNVGQWLNGKTIDRILVGYDLAPSTGQFRGYIDDILINN